MADIVRETFQVWFLAFFMLCHFLDLPIIVRHMPLVSLREISDLAFDYPWTMDITSKPVQMVGPSHSACWLVGLHARWRDETFSTLFGQLPKIWMTFSVALS